jgi:3-hydroxyacyl-[acyl-carrier-protein] dehydratase
MLLNNFFKISNIESGDKHTVNIELNAYHNIYKGHFRGNPVAPGVCLAQMVKETVQQITGEKLMMVTGDNLKFTAVLNPMVHSKVVMVISLKDKDDGSLQADSTLSSGETNFFTFKGSFRKN